MPYTAEISRNNPTAIIFLLDQSRSMLDKQGGPDGPQGTKAENLATVLNRILNDLVLRCSKGDEILRYFQIAALGYTTNNNGRKTIIRSALGGNLAQKDMAWIDEIADNPLRVEKRKKNVSDGAGGLVEMDVIFPVWLEPVAEWGTPMCAALQYTYDLLGHWISQHARAFPPVIIHITDGDSTDGNPSRIASNIRNLATSDGNVLLFNLHLSSRMVPPIQFPNNPAGLPDKFATMLYNMSSEMPEKWIATAKEMGLPATSGSRGFVFNADLSATIRFIDIGTRQPTQLR